MIVLGCLGKFGALFVTIPEPVVGGMFLVMFGEYKFVFFVLNKSKQIIYRLGWYMASHF